MKKHIINLIAVLFVFALISLITGCSTSDAGSKEKESAGVVGAVAGAINAKDNTDDTKDVTNNKESGILGSLKGAVDALDVVDNVEEPEEEPEAETESDKAEEPKAKEQDTKSETKTKDKPVEKTKAKDKEVSKETKEVVKEPVKKKEPVKIKTEPMSGDFMSTVELNVRKSHSLSSNAVGVLKPYAKAVVSQKAVNPTDGITWYKIKAGDLTGWASSNFLKTYKKQEAPKPSTNNSGNTSSGNSSSGGGKSYAPNTIYYGNKAVPYQNVGMDAGVTDGTQTRAQRVIDTTNNAATYGGQATFNGNSNANTHFIGHNGGRNQFGGMHEHSEFIITDSAGNAFKYVRTSRYVVDAQGYDQSSGAAKIDRLLGSGSTNRVTLQSTKNHPMRWIVEAEFAGKVN